MRQRGQAAMTPEEAADTGAPSVFLAGGEIPDDPGRADIDMPRSLLAAGLRTEPLTSPFVGA